jgi:hypothetical protein
LGGGSVGVGGGSGGVGSGSGSVGGGSGGVGSGSGVVWAVGLVVCPNCPPAGLTLAGLLGVRVYNNSTEGMADSSLGAARVPTRAQGRSAVHCLTGVLS